MEKCEIEINIIRKKIKNINLRIQKDGSVTVTAPLLCDQKIIDDFIESKKDWITSHSNKILPKDGCILYMGENILASTIHMNIADFYAKESQTVLTTRFNIISKELSILNTPKLEIKPMRGKYGYYIKSEDTVCLNLNLIIAPLECIDYVIAHELIHTKYYNHGFGFQRAICAIYPHHKQLRKTLSNYII